MELPNKAVMETAGPTPTVAPASAARASISPVELLPQVAVTVPLIRAAQVGTGLAPRAVPAG
ncbi:hypothetical protein ACIRBX_37245 [Kitasatospora sp. NPDC096147]|uniref:hypothetical protein n=1 Tax=Kitasatospora sp. NPDC096147 TaxID=3364093 RepID=UPI0037F38A33